MAPGSHHYSMDSTDRGPAGVDARVDDGTDAGVAVGTGADTGTRDGDDSSRVGAGDPDDAGPSAARPVVLMIHGGYWRALSRHDTLFMAGVLVAEGIATVVVDYGLAPHTHLTEIIRQVRAAAAWIHHNGAGYGLSPARLVVAGSSAGAHLVAMTIADGWHEQAEVPRDVVRGGLLISGLFDLDPLRRTIVSEWLGLTAEQARAGSPLAVLADERRPYPDRPAAVVARASHEAPGFHRQSTVFYRQWAALAPAIELIVDERNHLALFLDLAHSDSALSAALIELVASTAPTLHDEG